jgi:glucokinase
MKQVEVEQKLGRAAFADGPRLLADIGATHARFALQTAPGEYQAVRVLQCDDYTGIVPLLRSYLADHPGINLNHSALALANPVHGDYIRMTNRDWQFSTDEVRRELGLHTLLVVNDFTALAMAIPGLKPADLMQVGGGAPAANSVIGVLGPGTGLGCSGVIPTVDGFVTLGSEGGHNNFAPADEREYAILQYAWQTWSHVSNERLISGPGMEIIYRAIARRNGRQVRDLTSQQIISGALKDNDAVHRGARMLQRDAGRRGRQPGRHARFVRRHLHRRRHRAAHGRVVPRFAVPRPLRGEGPLLLVPGRDPDLRDHHAEPGVLRRGHDPLGAPARPQRRQHADGARADLLRELTPAEQRVAQLVLEQPRLVLNEPIADIARMAEVSQPTVIRFCRSLGFTGLADFKLKFASSLTGAIPVRHSQVRNSDSTHDLSAKVVDNTVSAILKFRDQLDVRALDRAIALVAKAKKVEFYAMGNSRVVGLDGQHKFFRFRIPTASYGDSHLLSLAAELLQPGDVVIAISNSGRCRTCSKRWTWPAPAARTSSPSPPASRRWPRRPMCAWPSTTARTAPRSCR